MPFISPDVIEKVKELDLKSYLEMYEPQELVRVSPGEYSTRTHDSLKISHGKWMWWSRGIGGRNAVDYLMKVKEMTFYDAVNYLCDLTHTLPTRKAVSIQPQNKAPPEKYLQIPEKASDNDKLFEYLQSRGISKTVIDECIKRGCIYESMPMHNIAFVGFDDNNKPRYIGLRGLTEPRFIGDSYGSDKRYTFRLLSDNQESLHIFEGSIDLLSYATLIELNGGDWKKQNLMTLSGVYSPKQFSETTKIPVAIDEYIKNHPQLKTVYLHFDNDIAGRNAAASIAKMLSERFEVVNSPPPYGKDVNEYLCSKLHLPIKTHKGRSYER